MKDFEAAIDNADSDAIQELLADPQWLSQRNSEGQTPALYALYHGKRDLACKLAAAMKPADLHSAAACGTQEQVALALAEGSDVDSLSTDGFNALSLASAFNETPMVCLLLSKGANVNARCSALGGVTSIHASVFGRSDGNLEALLERGADPNIRQAGGFTALHGAAQNGATNQVRILIDHGANANLRSEEGKTASTYASEAGHQSLSEILSGYEN